MKIKPAVFFFVLLQVIIPHDSFCQLNTDSLKHIIANTKDENNLTGTYNNYAFQLYRTQPDSSIFYAQKALKSALKNNDENQANSAYNILGLSYQSKGMYTLSVLNFKKAMLYDVKDTADRATLLHNMALTYRNMKQTADALKYELEAIKLLETEKDSLILGTVYETICGIYRDMGEYKQAQDYILKAINIFSRIKDYGIGNGKSYIANAYADYGNLLQAGGNINGAIEKHKQSIQLHKESGDDYNMAIAYENLGDDYAALKQYKNAIANYASAKKLMTQVNSGTDVGYELYKMADVYKSSGNYTDALRYADSALALFTINNADGYRLDLYKLKYEIFDSLNNAGASLQFYKKYNALKDSLNIEAQKKDLFQLKAQYEITQKEQQIKSLETEKNLKEQKFKSEQFLKRLILVIFSIALILSFLFIRSINRKRKEILQQKNHIESQRFEIEKSYENLKATQTQLVQSEKMASLADLTSGIAHEIQNPLNFVNNFSEINKELIEELKDERTKIKDKRDEQLEDEIINDIKQNLEKINHHGKRADAIVKNMLLHTGRSSGQKEPISINALCDEYLKLAYLNFRAKNKMFTTDFNTDYDTSIHDIKIAPQDIGRLLLNIFNNAFYAMNEKCKNPQDLSTYKPLVSVKTKKLNDRIEIIIHDNGNGIHQTIIDKIFQPFFTTKPTGQGTGLGLSLSYDIVKAHGGDLKATSNENEGSEFIICLPL